MNEGDAKIIIAQILLTIDYFERRGIIHRDLKPENILLTKTEDLENEIMIADFGFALDFT